MPRKRKSRAIEPPQETEPEPVQNDEPETKLPDLEETQQTQGQEDPGVGDEVAVVVEEEEGNEEQEGEQELPLIMEEDHNKDDVLGEKNEEESDFSLKLSENDAVLVNGGAAEGQNDEDEEEELKDEEEELEEEPLEKILEPFSKDQLTLLIKEAVAKHPDVVQNVHKLADADPSHRKIFVHGLGWDANTESIASAFGKYGEIEDCKIAPPKDVSVGVVAAKCVRSCRERRPSMKEVAECLSELSKLVPIHSWNGLTNPCLMIETVGRPVQSRSVQVNSRGMDFDDGNAKVRKSLRNPRRVTLTWGCGAI